MNRFNASLALLLLAYSPIYACPVSACNCMIDARSAEQRVAEARQNGAIIFYGRVLDIKSKGDLAVTFAVNETWSPNISSRITITTAPDTGMCGYHFVKNREYLVIAYQHNKELSVSLCSNTQDGFPGDFKTALGPGYFSRNQVALWWKYSIAAWLMTFAFLKLRRQRKHPIPC